MLASIIAIVELGCATAGPGRVVGVFADGRTCRVGEPTPPAPPGFVGAVPAEARTVADGGWTVAEGVGVEGLGIGTPPEDVGPAIGTLGPLRSA